MNPPSFTKGTHFYSICGPWRFVTSGDVRLRTNLPLPDASFRDKDGREWMQWEKGWVLIRDGYAWNGNTLAPNTPRNMLGSLVHDCLYQMSGVKGFPVSRAEADRLMLDINRANKFTFATIYHAAVSQFGGMFWGRDRGMSMQPL
jgi:hypothetical protein